MKRVDMSEMIDLTDCSMIAPVNAGGVGRCGATRWGNLAPASSAAADWWRRVLEDDFQSEERGD
jgi:hypothetical protein